MTTARYVSTDAAGVEHAAGGPIHWSLPPDGADAAETTGAVLVLREPAALLDVLDEAIYAVEAVGPAAPAGEGAVTATRARILRRTPWGTEAAVRLALACAGNALGDAGDVSLPGGITLAKALADAGAALDGAQGAGYLARLAGLSALRRLSRERRELSDVLTKVLAQDVARDLDALDDPAFDAVRTVVDAVLAAVEALRHHLLPAAYTGPEEAREGREAYRNEDRADVMAAPTVTITPWGPVTLGPHVLAHEPAWAAARECARHAREAARIRAGGRAEAERAERAWQGERLAALLEPRAATAR